ncbi:unnamed protein product [Alopecurus aequalis]
MPKFKKNPNPQIFMDISIDGRAAERITFELFANVVPRTAENFRALCTGERGLGESTKKPLYFKGTHIHRIIPGFMAQGGDFSTGDGRGGESIYGGKFPDENFKLKHDQPGILSMANSGKNSNGSQFFITFNATPHLDGKHVVFGKALDGKALLKKLEALGSDSGKPKGLVKIVDCGEASSLDTQNQLHGEKEKKLKKTEDNSDSEGRVKTKKTPSEDKRKKKRKYYSSDSYSSETSDSQSYSSDSGSGSESYSSASLDTSSSSDHRHKRRKGSKKVKRKSAKRKSNHKKSKSKTRGTKRKSKRSYGSSSDDSKSSSSSSDNESAGRHTKHSLKKDKENPKTINLEKGKTLEDADKGKETAAGSKPLHKDENGADVRVGNQNSEDRSSKFRDDTNPIRADATLSKPYGNSTADAAGTGISEAGTEPNPVSNEPVPTNGKDLAKGSTADGRVRKGRGFTQQYSFARRYRTPSPERSPVRSHYNGGRNDRWGNFNRYGRNGPYGARSPARRYHGSPRASSPPRYTRRDRSRSRSRSPVRRRDGGGHRRPSPRRGRTPADQQKRDVSYRPRSGCGGGGGGGPGPHGSSPSPNRGRSRSRSKSRGASRSRSPDAAPAKKVSSKYNRRRSSSSRSSSPSGSKGGLVSY